MVNVVNNPLAINRFVLLFIFLFPMITVFAENQGQRERPGYLMHSDNKYVDTNELSQVELDGVSKSSLYFQFNTSGLFSSLSDWKNQLHMSDGTHPSSNNIVFGAEGGCVLNEFLQIGVGYEFFFTTKVATNETSG